MTRISTRSCNPCLTEESYGLPHMAITMSIQPFTRSTFQEENKYDRSCTQHSPPEVPGITNYFLPVFTRHSADTPIFILWFFDSRGGQSFQDQQTPTAILDWVSRVTVNWFRSSQSQMIKQWEYLPPSMVFVHIPPSHSFFHKKTSVEKTVVDDQIRVIEKLITSQA